MKKENDANRMLRQQREWQAAKARGDHGAAVGGQPAKRGWRWWQIALAAFFGLAFLGALLPKPDKVETLTQSSNSETASSEGTQAASDASRPSKWSYNTYRDEMRGTESKTATVASENTVKLDFPYGEQQGELTLRTDPKSGLNVMVSVEKGQILCNSFSENHISAKFDGGPVQNFRCTDASDGSSNVAFIVDEKTFLKKVRGAKRTIVEAEFFQQGRQQFVFETTGLDWK